MTLVVIRPILNLTQLNIDYLNKYYPKDVNTGAKIFFIISRVFNDEFKNIPITFDEPFLREISQSSSFSSIKPYNYFLEVGDIVDQYHIAKGYYFEIIIRYITNKGKVKTIFPGEIRRQSDENFGDLPDPIIETMVDVMEPHEVTTQLQSLNLPLISGDLTQSIMRLKRSDFDGSIKFSRKVIEGIRQLKIEDFITESNRQDKFKAFVTSSFNLLSNFGEHSGTTASEEEAILAKEIALELSRYIVSKCTV
ncbi:MAG: hypothetical protein ABSE07_06320 [Methanoregula sp.]|jgi:hypothetical protein